MGASKKKGRGVATYFPEKLPQIVLGTQLTDCISNSKLYKKCGSILLSRVKIRERMRWLGNVLQMKDDRWPKTVLAGQPSRAKQKAGCPQIGWEIVIRKDLRETRASWEGVKRDALNRLG
jgi:hypothetical protein